MWAETKNSPCKGTVGGLTRRLVQNLGHQVLRKTLQKYEQIMAAPARNLDTRWDKTGSSSPGHGWMVFLHSGHGKTVLLIQDSPFSELPSHFFCGSLKFCVRADPASPP